MKAPILPVLSAFAAVFHFPVTAGAQASAPAPGSVAPDRYIVTVKPGQSPAAVAGANGILPDAVFTRVANGFSGVLGRGRLARLQADSRVAAIVPDRVVSANPKGGGGGGGKPPGDGGGGTDGGTTTTRDPQVVPSGVTRIGAAPGATGFTGAGVGVAVVDTGIDMVHPDLAPNLGSTSFKAVAKGFRISTQESRNAGQDDEGHGTHVAATIAAADDDGDVVGVAPGATVYAVKVLDQRGSGLDSTVILGLEWIAERANAVDPPIRVVNMSLGRTGTVGDNPTYEAAIDALHGMGITVITSAGNDCDQTVDEKIPAAYANAFAIASTTAEYGTTDGSAGSLIIFADTASFFTTDGAGVLVSAPGEQREDIAAGYLQSVGILSAKLGGGTTRLSGTSMAAPHAAGVAALLLEKDATLDPDTIADCLFGGADRPGAVPLGAPTSCYTFDGVREGVLSASGALRLLP